MNAAKRLALWFVAGCAGIGAVVGAAVEIEQWYLRRSAG